MFANDSKSAKSNGHHFRRSFRHHEEQTVLYRTIIRLSYRGFDTCRGVEDSDVTAEDYERIKGRCIETLQNDLPRECRNLGLPVVSAYFKRADSGSLELLFTTVWDFVQFAGDTAAFYDAVCLVGSLVEKLLERVATGGGRTDMQADVFCEPVLPSRDSLRGDSRLGMSVHADNSRNAAALRAAVIFLGIAVVVLAVGLTCLGWKMASM